MANWAGFKPLRAGHIHVFCPRCHKRFSNVSKLPEDPRSAELVHEWCDNCSSGCKDTPSYFYNGRGQRIKNF